MIPVAEYSTALALARKYIWWQVPEQVVQNPNRLILQLMNLATWRDQQWLEKFFSREELAATLSQAGAGTLNAKSWNYWHLKLGLPVPPLPQKKI